MRLLITAAEDGSSKWSILYMVGNFQGENFANDFNNLVLYLEDGSLPKIYFQNVCEQKI